MCYRTQINSKPIDIKKRFNVEIEFPVLEFPQGEINGFSHPLLPVISDRSPQQLSMMEWGIIPHWAKDKKLQVNTLNCMIETAEDKPSFKYAAGNRCLVIADGFFEWKHEKINGKLVKQKHLITVPGGGLFAMAGIYNHWNGLDTFTILTTVANELMADIHNTKKRMPVILCPEEEAFWLKKEPLHLYHSRAEVDLVAVPLT
ncbi:MAG TPA: SOS response-associated peptidase [Flavobacterium sp.]|jgi:putative SOS response-associated peptidase YedK